MPARYHPPGEVDLRHRICRRGGLCRRKRRLVVTRPDPAFPVRASRRYVVSRLLQSQAHGGLLGYGCALKLDDGLAKTARHVGDEASLAVDATSSERAASVSRSRLGALSSSVTADNLGWTHHMRLMLSERAGGCWEYSDVIAPGGRGLLYLSLNRTFWKIVMRVRDAVGRQ